MVLTIAETTFHVRVGGRHGLPRVVSCQGSLGPVTVVLVPARSQRNKILGVLAK